MKCCGQSFIQGHYPPIYQRNRRGLFVLYSSVNFGNRFSASYAASEDKQKMYLQTNKQNKKQKQKKNCKKQTLNIMDFFFLG